MTSPRLERRETMSHLVGYGLALLLTLGAFALVYCRLLDGRATFHIVLGLGLVQMLVHFRCFLHIDLKRSARADLTLLLFSCTIIALMVAGTVVILSDLRERMM